jgi:hypothetical protein
VSQSELDAMLKPLVRKAMMFPPEADDAAARCKSKFGVRQ